ncbi:MAG: hypothetical protein D6729_10770 [Deltaproteobacteria bacterium]|nr:MAG: hypothetical protein D6729_10770 [Deltaproteobacteria bacterium]
MKRFHGQCWVLSGLTALLVCGPVAAQAPANPEAASAQVANPEAELGEDLERLSPKEMVDKAELYVEEMREILKEVLRVLEDAREEKDLVKLNCVNEKLTQVKGLLRVSENSLIGLQEAVAKQDPDEAQHQYAKIAIARENSSKLRAEAEECIGQLAFVIDEDTIVDVEIPEDLPDQVSEYQPPAPVIVRPPAASPVN